MTVYVDTVYVETDFLLAITTDSDWHQLSVEEVLETYEVETSAFSYLEIILAHAQHDFDCASLVTNLLELVPVQDEQEKQAILKTVIYYERGMTPLDAFHAATADAREMDMLSPM